MLLNADSVTPSNKASSLISSSGYLKLYEFQIKRILIYQVTSQHRGLWDFLPSESEDQALYGGHLLYPVRW